MITVNQYLAIAVIVAVYVLAYYFGKEIGYGNGFKLSANV